MKIYKDNNLNEGNYVSEIKSINSTNDILYFDGESKYYLNFYSNQYLGNFSFNLCKLDCNYDESEKYLVHLKYDSSDIGYKYNIEKHNELFIDNNIKTDSLFFFNTSKYYNGNGYTSVLDDNTNFGYDNDNRVIINNPLYECYSAICKMKCNYIINNHSYSSSGTGTFVNANIILSAAHMYYAKSNDGTSIVKKSKFYPGISKYPIDQNKCGYFNAKEVYLPISYILNPNCATQYDWSITIVDDGNECELKHGYMGMQQLYLDTCNNIQSIGYPG